MNSSEICVSLRRWYRFCGLDFPMVGFFTFLFIQASASMAEEKPSLQAILDSWTATEAQVLASDSMLIEYERDSSVTVSPEFEDGELLLQKWKTGYRSGKWYSEHQFFTTLGKSEERNYQKPSVNVTKDGLVLEYNSRKESAVVDRSELGRNLYKDMQYFRNTWLNAPLHIARSLGLEQRMEDIRVEFAMYVDLPFLPMFVENNRKQYQLLEVQEQIDGVNCLVISWPGMDTIWIDPLLGNSVKRRRIAWSPGGPLRSDIVSSDFRPVKDGVWLPFHQSELTYFDPRFAKPKAQGRVRFQATYKVLSVAFDTVDESLFDITIPSGTVVFDAPRNFTYRTAEDGSDPFGEPINAAKEQMEMLANRAGTQSNFRVLLVVANVILCVVVALYVFLKRRLQP